MKPQSHSSSDPRKANTHSTHGNLKPQRGGGEGRRRGAARAYTTGTFFCNETTDLTSDLSRSRPRDIAAYNISSAVRPISWYLRHSHGYTRARACIRAPHRLPGLCRAAYKRARMFEERVRRAAREGGTRRIVNSLPYACTSEAARGRTEWLRRLPKGNHLE